MTDTTRSYYACKFRAEDSRTYTYHFDGPAFAIGDIVRVEDRSGDGWKRVQVASVSDTAPPFATKPILCLHVDDRPAPADAA